MSIKTELSDSKRLDIWSKARDICDIYERYLEGLSCMRGNSHVQFLGGENASNGVLLIKHEIHYGNVNE